MLLVRSFISNIYPTNWGEFLVIYYFGNAKYHKNVSWRQGP